MKQDLIKRGWVLLLLLYALLVSLTLMVGFLTQGFVPERACDSLCQTQGYVSLANGAFVLFLTALFIKPFLTRTIFKRIFLVYFIGIHLSFIIHALILT